MLPLTHPSPRPKGHLNRFSHFSTAHGRVSLYFTIGCPPPQNCPIRMEVLDLHQRHGSLDHRSSQPKRRFNRFSRDRPTDHATPSVTIGLIYARTTATRPNNIPSGNRCLTSIKVLCNISEILKEHLLVFKRSDACGCVSRWGISTTQHSVSYYPYGGLYVQTLLRYMYRMISGI